MVLVGRLLNMGLGFRVQGLGLESLLRILSYGPYINILSESRKTPILFS